MPNWCSNTVNVSGPPADVERFLFQAQQKHLSWNRKEAWPSSAPEGWVEDTGFFWNFVTPPASIQNPEHYWGSNVHGEHPSGHWYEWNAEHWGTKWDVDPDITAMSYPDVMRVSITFESAWAPPTPVIAAIAEQYPMLRIKHDFSEEGASFWGNVIYDNGTEIERQEGECDHAWYVEHYGFCPFVEWNDAAPGTACPDCGEVVPNDDETALSAST